MVDKQLAEPGLAVIEAGMINILVFNAADKFGIEGLKETAFQKFIQWASASWNLDYFSEVIEEALKLELIPPREEKIIARTISRHPSLEKLLENPTINTILNSSASLATLVIKDLVQSRRLRRLMDRDSLSDDRLQLEVAVANLLYKTFEKTPTSESICRRCRGPERPEPCSITNHCIWCKLHRTHDLAEPYQKGQHGARCQDDDY